MILESIMVEAWRCFRDRVELADFSERINVIFGPNGSGKSSLMLALVRGLFDNHSVVGHAVEQLRPWGRSLSPRVTIQFAHEGNRYRLHKQFLTGAYSRLERFEDNRFVGLAEGRFADEFVRRLLEGESPGRGLTDQRHWGLAQILWTPQGQLPLEHVSQSTVRAIRQALGVQLSADAGPIENRIREEFDRYFTSTGRYRTGAQAPPITRWQRERETKQQARSELQAQLERFEAVSRQIRDQTAILKQQEHDIAHLERTLEQEREKARQYQELEHLRKLKEIQLRASEEEYLRVHDQLEQIRRAQSEWQEAERQRQQLNAALPEAQSRVTRYEQRTSQAQQELAAIRLERPKVQAARRRAQRAAEFRTLTSQREHLDAKIAHLEDLFAKRQTILEQLQNLVAPDEERFHRIRSAIEERDRLRLQLDQSVITLHLVPERAFELQVLKGETPGSMRAEPNAPAIIRGAPDVAVQLPGIGYLEATGPTTDITGLREAYQERCRTVEELMAPYRTTSLAELQRLYEVRRALQQNLRELDIQLNTLLESKRLEQWHQEQSSVRQQLLELLAEFPDWQQAAPDPQQLQQDADNFERQFVERVEQAERQWDEFQRSLQAAQQQFLLQQTQLQSLEDQLVAAQSRLEVLRQDGLTDEQRTRKCQQLALQADAARGELHEVELQLQQFGSDPRQAVATLEQQLQRLRESQQSSRDQLQRLEGAIATLSEQAPYSALADLDEEIQQLERQIQQEERRAKAIHLLYSVMMHVRENTMAAIVAPIENRAMHTLRRIVGSRFERLQFGEQMIPTAVIPSTSNDAVDLDQISGGEKEQLFFAVRLALAEIAFPRGRHLVVLDDVFTYTDASRLARVQAVLEEASDRFQIVLLTCHPERYFGLRDARIFDLETLAAAHNI